MANHTLLLKSRHNSTGVKLLAVRRSVVIVVIVIIIVVIGSVVLTCTGRFFGFWFRGGHNTLSKESE